ncbi:MAG: hypothetical protein ACI9VR_003461 [Cognaticolwellia sp.]|jgi:hypothetical protein
MSGAFVQDLFLFGCVLGTMYGARWIAGKLGWLPETSFLIRTMADHARAVLREKLGLLTGEKEPERLEKEGFPVGFLVDDRSRSLCHVALEAEAPLGELKLEFGVPIYVGAAVVAWVDPQQPTEHLDWCLDMAHAVHGSGLWGELELAYGLTKGRLQTGHPFIQGSVHGRAVCITQTADGLSLVASVPAGLRAVLGAGETGNPVLDMLLETQGVPPGAEEAVLSLVHGLGAQLQDGELGVLHAGPLGAVWPAVRTLLGAVEGGAVGSQG